ncbi:hypothetical protein O0L34_g12730 [Tuta absoluta]|nr:hypothetical protein O0L34_g12730 [Tuta absoluta]
MCADLNKTNLVETTRDQTECTKTNCDDCVCRQLWSAAAGEGIEVECRDKIVYRIPDVKGIRKLLAHSNQISLRKEDIPDSLTYLDLTNNNITIVEKEAARKLFSVENRQMLLSGNQIRCICGNVHFIKHIKKHKNQVLDYKKVTCGQEELLLDYVDADIKMCKNKSNESKLKSLLQSQNDDKLSESNIASDPEVSEFNIALVAPLAVFGILLPLTVLAILLNYQWRQKLRATLCARRWCPFYAEEVDYFYDAFVSFCHEDDDFTCQVLVPKLEKLGYKLCIHHRDWVPGDLIPTQILRSVKTSRKTVIVLSKNFAFSIWGYLEFKTAHEQALENGVERVILIVLDDVIEMDNLNKDLLSYIQINTYVKWSDPYFWNKIQVSLRKRRTHQNPIGKQIKLFDNPRTLISKSISKIQTVQNYT